MPEKDKLVTVMSKFTAQERINKIIRNNDRIFGKKKQFDKDQWKTNYKHNEGRLPWDRKWEYKPKPIVEKDWIIRTVAKDWINEEHTVYFIRTTDAAAALNKLKKTFPDGKPGLLSINFNSRAYEILDVWPLNQALKAATYRPENAEYSGWRCIDLDDIQNSIIKYLRWKAWEHIKAKGVKQYVSKSFVSKKDRWEKTVSKHKRKDRRNRLSILKRNLKYELVNNSKGIIENDFKVCLKHPTTKEVVRVWNSERHEHDSLYATWHITSKSIWKSYFKDKSLPDITVSKKNLAKIKLSLDKNNKHFLKVTKIQETRAKRELEFKKQLEDYQNEKERIDNLRSKE